MSLYTPGVQCTEGKERLTVFDCENYGRYEKKGDYVMNQEKWELEKRQRIGQRTPIPDEQFIVRKPYKKRMQKVKQEGRW